MQGAEYGSAILANGKNMGNSNYSLTIGNSKFENNSALFEGGAIKINDISIDITYTDFNLNSAGDLAGALYLGCSLQRS